jgi:Est1 DNA/RNA binding domain/Telomerase activating protein Est1
MLASFDRERDHIQHGGNSKGRPPKNVVEKRRLAQRFRQFLAAEDKFWRSFIVRYTTSFNLTDTKAILLSTIGGELDVVEDATERSIFPYSQVEQHPPKEGEREHRLAILSKALVCLGDLTRYREQQGEATKNEHANTSRGRGSRHQANGPAHSPSYSKSQSLYECAHTLNPDTGNASHQLAIISNYQKDTFSAIYHYYRALCVRHPFDTASENLQTVLTKALDSYISQGDRIDEQISSSLSPKAQVESLKEKVVLLHASFRLSPEE